MTEKYDGGDRPSPAAKNKYLLTSYPLYMLGSEIYDINVANGWDVSTSDTWDDPNKLLAKLMLIVSEVAEACEGARKGDRDNVAEELSDTLIRVLDLSHGLGINMDVVVAAKLAKNRTRGYRHGGKLV